MLASGFASLPFHLQGEHEAVPSNGHDKEMMSVTSMAYVKSAKLSVQGQKEITMRQKEHQ